MTYISANCTHGNLARLVCSATYVLDILCISQGPGCLSSSPQVSTSRAEARHRSHCSARLRRSERVRECVPQERILGPEKPRPMPDPTLFLYPFTQRLLPLHISLGGHCGEGDSQRRMGRLRTRAMREDTGPETTDL